MNKLFKHSEELLEKAISEAELEAWKKLDKLGKGAENASKKIVELRTELSTLQLLSQTIENRLKTTKQ